AAPGVVPMEVEGPVGGEDAEPEYEQGPRGRVAAFSPDRPGHEEPQQLAIGQVERVVMKTMQRVAERPADAESLRAETSDHVTVLVAATEGFPDAKAEAARGAIGQPVVAKLHRPQSAP